MSFNLQIHKVKNKEAREKEKKKHTLSKSSSSSSMGLMDCKKCGLGQHTIKYPPKDNVDVLFLGEYPIEADFENNEPFSGKAGALLKNVIEDVGLNNYDFYYALQCRPPKGKATVTQLKCCKQYIDLRINKMKPKLVVLLGYSTVGTYIPDWQKKPATMLGNFAVRDGQTYFVTFDPLFVARNIHYKTFFKQHIERIQRFLNNELFIDRKYDLITTIEQVQEWTEKIINAEEVSVDVETDSLEWDNIENRILTVAFSTQLGRGCCFPLHHPETPPEIQKAVPKALSLILQSDVKKYFHNGAFDIKMLNTHSYEINNYAGDTMILYYLLNENRPKYSLKNLVAEELNGYENLVNPSELQPLNELYYYNCEDADFTMELHRKGYPYLTDLQKKLYKTILLPARSILIKMEQNGVLFDTKAAQELEISLKKQLEDLHKVIESSYPETIGKNLNSTKQLQELFFDEYQLPVIAKTRKDNPQLSESVLKKYATSHKFKLAEYVLQIRRLEKQLSTYVGKFSNITRKDGRIHGLYKLIRTVTGRLASSGPNLQNIPRDPLVRNLFIAQPGHLLVQMDFSQAELRIAASLANETTMITAYNNDIDLHRLTAASVLDKNIEEVTKEDRQKAKPVNFGFLYGQSAKGFKEYAKSNYGVIFSESEAVKIRKKFFETYQNLPVWYDYIQHELLTKKEVETVFGRKRRFPNLPMISDKSFNDYVRQAINAPVQSTSSDCLLIVLIKSMKMIEKLNIPARPILTVHDSIDFEVREDAIEDLITCIDTAVEYLNSTSSFLRVKMKADYEYGITWGNLKPWS